MTTAAPIAAVFDCSVFAQALINPRGPAAACFTAAQEGRVRLFLSEYVLAEVRELSNKLPPRVRPSADRVERLIADLARYAHVVSNVPAVFPYPRDPDDAHYVDLALAADATFIVSRDRDLLDLSDLKHEASRQFVARFPQLRLIDPPAFLRLIPLEWDEFNQPEP
jgi:uncharacterized protein